MQIMTPAAAALLAGGASGSVTGAGCARPDGNVEVRSTLLLVCAPCAPTVLLPLAESAVRVKSAAAAAAAASGEAAGSGLGGAPPPQQQQQQHAAAFSERLFPRVTREEALEMM